MLKIFRAASIGLALALCLGNFAKSSDAHAEEVSMTSVTANNGWKSYPVKYYLDKDKQVRYCEFEAENHNKAHMIVLPINRAKLSLMPTGNSPVCTTSQATFREGGIAGVNGAYFNIHGGMTASYVTVNGQVVCDPRENSMFTGNSKLKPYMEAILNRSELRVLIDSKGRTALRIQNHTDKVPEGYTLKHALQAGPRLLPAVMAKEEGFLRTEENGTLFDAIGVLKTAARTAFGITPDDHAIILCIAGPKQDEFSSGMTLAQMADLLKQLGCAEAINFDGGTSTTMIVRDNTKVGTAKEMNHEVVVKEKQIDRYRETEKEKEKIIATVKEEVKEEVLEGKIPAGLKMVCGREPETIVKSCLILKEEP